jgi:CubicO group peptidase (beta-lactamase class C family)
VPPSFPPSRATAPASRYRRHGRWRTLAALAAACLVPLAPTPVAGQASTPAAGPATLPEAALAAFGEALARDVAADDVGGIVAGVAVDGDLVWARAFGWADRDLRIPLRTSAISRTGSISKSVTALLLMRLVDQGVVGLDDPAARHLPELRGLEDPGGGVPEITLRQLASHTSGLIREPRLQGAAEGPVEGWQAKVLASIPATGFAHAPGEAYLYSNIGFGILGLALERAAGRPFMELVEEEIFRPLGMTGSTFVVDAELAPRLAAGYRNDARGGVDAEAPAREHLGRGYKVPNGGVYASVADLGRFAGAVGGTPGLRLLTEASRREMLRIQTPEDRERGYGLGFTVRQEEDGRCVVSHGGSVAGYTAHLALDPGSGVAVILLRTYQSGATSLGGAATGLLAALTGEGAVPGGGCG